MTKNVMVLGCDGFCGWPTMLHLAAQGYTTHGIDSFVRRQIDRDYNWNSLTPIASPDMRKACALDTFPHMATLAHANLDQVGMCESLAERIDQQEISAIVHLAEQRSAPYSMRRAGSIFTVRNNIGVTHNVLEAIRLSKRKPHLVHLGTMGVYGYGRLGKITTPEGYIEATFGEELEITTEILHPMYPGSVYHMTKCMDHTMFQFYAQNWGLRITDLHQGIVWGTQTDETKHARRLINRFDYDGDFGTVLNRFLVQAACDVPLTVYGTGGQTRAFIHISDTVKCIRLAIDNPPLAGDKPAIYNQVAETASVRDVANAVLTVAGRSKLMEFMANPRKEAAENDLVVANTNFRSLGWKPKMLNEESLAQEYSLAVGHALRANRERIMPEVKW